MAETEHHDLPAGEAGHFGGDAGLLVHFTEVVARDAVAEVRTSGRVSLISHVLGFAAETARADSRIVSIENPLPVYGDD